MIEINLSVIYPIVNTSQLTTDYIASSYLCNDSNEYQASKIEWRKR